MIDRRWIIRAYYCRNFDLDAALRVKRKPLNILQIRGVRFINLHFTVGARKGDLIQLHTAYI